jgi:uncharacterized protein DUF4058
MPNPFPGMDPYLEGDEWMSVHTSLCEEIARQLSPKLRPKYFVRSTRRVILAVDEENGSSATDRIPDVGILSSYSTNGGGVAAKTAAPLVVDSLMPEPIPHVSVEIRDAAERRLVTCIEVLSPTNKLGSGREEYAAKRLQILSGPANLVEIDLLRAGTRYPTAKPLPAAPYFVFVCRGKRTSKVELWPIGLYEPLPQQLSIPLLEGDPDATLDLQLAFRTVYDIFAFDESLDYTQPPPGPLTSEQAKWIDERLKSAGRRD